MKVLIIQMLVVPMAKAASVVSPDSDPHLHQCTVVKTQRQSSRS